MAKYRDLKFFIFVVTFVLVCQQLALFWIGLPCSWRKIHRIEFWLWKRPDKDVPVFVTGGNSETYSMSKAFLIDIYKTQNSRYKGFELEYFDFGLTADQRQDLESFCGPCECVIRQIPILKLVRDLPKDGSRFYEAIVMKEMMKQHKYAMWIDSSIKLNASVDMTHIFNKASKTGVQIAQGTRLIDDEYGLSLDDFVYIKENPVYYTNKKTLDTRWWIIRNLDYSTDYFIKQYFSCVERAMCSKVDLGSACISQHIHRKFTHKQCLDILTLKLIKDFDNCYRSFSFSAEQYAVNFSSHTCIWNNALNY